MSPPLPADATDSADDEHVYSTIDSLPVVQDEFEAGAESVECVEGVGGGDAHVGLTPSQCLPPTPLCAMPAGSGSRRVRARGVGRGGRWGKVQGGEGHGHHTRGTPQKTPENGPETKGQTHARYCLLREEGGRRERGGGREEQGGKRSTWRTSSCPSSLVPPSLECLYICSLVCMGVTCTHRSWAAGSIKSCSPSTSCTRRTE